MSGWPASNDYTIAVQSPHLCFRDGDLVSAQLERLSFNAMPKVWTGNFAQVYQLKGPAGRWAVKCFTRPVPDIRARYAAIAAALVRSRVRCFVDFRLIDDEMLVAGARYPIVKMEWADGQRLDQFVAANLYRPRALLEIAASLQDLVKALERERLAHGDLQHGNILVSAAGIRLLDYDGVFVPAFAGSPAPEVGLPCYQHPRRGPADYGAGLDRFSLLTICTALAALAADPGLWREFHTGDNLLFTSADYADPAASPALQRLCAMDDPQVRGLAQSLVAACAAPPLDVPLPAPISLRSTPRHGFWWVGESARSGNGNGNGASNGHAASPAERIGAMWVRLLGRQFRIRIKLPRRT